MLLRHYMTRHSQSRGTPYQSYGHRATKHLQAQLLQDKIKLLITASGKKHTIDSLLQIDPHTQGSALSNEVGRLAQGYQNIKGNNTLCFIPKKLVPQNLNVAYANMVCDYRPNKKEKHRVRLTVGGDVLNYFGDSASPAV